MNRPKWTFTEFVTVSFFNSTSLSENNLIITTYDTMLYELKSVMAKKLTGIKSDDIVTVDDESLEAKTVVGPLFSIFWERIILDEAHQIRNPKAQTTIAACKCVYQIKKRLCGPQLE